MPEPRYASIVLRLRLSVPTEGPVATPENIRRKLMRLLQNHMLLEDEPAWTRTPLSVRVVLFDSSGRPIEQGT
jgi:hypothetical protein